MNTTTLFKTLVLPTGTWTIEIVHSAGTTQIQLPKVEVDEYTLPADPWADEPITHDVTGAPIYAATQIMYR